ncbi:hypothetical protein [Kitasatospora sp. MAP5-34]|uniref:DUF6968 family protein n=1 Tax=Kitasatospora sp. MAP5-34 TaxID=3035102 RepID=UPI002475EA67|nr:hypothetical protein [Kitasatospora sp. MAP5-34]MDH6577766.1 hypothetical protein [Kitasatospora sp. MAP5-34]
MENQPLGEVIAERVLEVHHPDGSTHRVVIRIGRPYPAREKGLDWSCPGQVDGLGDDSVVTVHGVDALQALLLCLYRVRSAVRHLSAERGLRVTWLEGDDLGLRIDPDTPAEELL